MEATKKIIIYPSITSQTKNGAVEKLKEADERSLTEIAFFPTGMTFQQRRSFYKQLKKSSIKKIPCLHLRNDMEEEEISWLIKTYQVKFLNIHSRRSPYPFELDFSFCKDKVYVENSFAALETEEANQFAGVCLDFAHLENNRRLNPDWYSKNLAVIKKAKVGWGHLGAIAVKTRPCPITGKPTHDSHRFSSLSELDYLKRYAPILPNVLALELENNLEEQLEAKKYIEKMLEGKK